MNGTLSATQLSTFQRDGFLVIEDLLSADEIATLGKAR